MRKNISILSIISFFLIWAWIYSLNARDTKAPVCQYTNEVEACYQANQPGWLWNRNIGWKDNPICIASQDREKIAYNIILDIKFKKIDEKVELKLKEIEKNKTEYFWTESEKTIFDAIPDLNHLFADSTTWFYKEYQDICSNNTILSEALACSNLWTVKEWSKFIENNTWDNICMSLAKTKLAVYRQVRSDLLKLNKKQVKDDYVKKHTQEQRTKYDDLLDKMSVNKNYINKINQKWNVKCKDCE